MKKSGCTVFLLLIPGVVCAGDPVIVNIQGKITAAPCQVSSDSINQTIDLTAGEKVTASSMYTPGSATKWVNFRFNVENCPAGTSKATIQFNGVVDNNNPDDMYANNGTAGNVAVQLQRSNGEPLGNNKQSTGIIENARYSWGLRARIFSEKGNVTPGTINAAVTATITWQ